MRKEVKLGFAIGGVVLAVVIVWTLAVSGSGKPKTEASAGAGAAENAPSITPSREALNSDRPLTVTSGAPAPFTTASAGATASSASQEVPQSGDVDWGKLLNGEAASMTLMNSGQSNTANRPTTIPSGPRSAADSSAIVPDPLGSRDAAAPQSDALNHTIAAAIPMPGDATLDSATVSRQADSTAAGATPALAQAADHSIPASATRLPSTPPVAPSRTHIVQRGETPSSIAAVAYGNASYFPHILRANPRLDPKRMKPGMSIILPDVAEVKPHDGPGAGAQTDHTVAVDATRQYKVQSGDSLYSISIKLYGKADMQQKIYDLNKDQIGPDQNKLKLGTILKLPFAPTASSR